MQRGTVSVERFPSKLLKSNPLRDPSVRDLYVYLPPSYYTSSKEYPVVYCLAGFTSSARSWFNFQAWTPSMDERMDTLIAAGMPEMILVFPDCFTGYGGSQYLDSPASGRYRSYLIEEIVPFIDKKFRSLKSRAFRGILGKSSGGFGAIRIAMDHPDLFSAVACHSGDMYFEYCYLPDFPKAFRGLKKSGGLREYVRRLLTVPAQVKDDFSLLNIVAMSACYSPNPRRKPYKFDLPFDQKTGEILPGIWKKWKSHDPIEILKTRKKKLKKLGLIFLDCGRKDEFFLNIGARLFVSQLQRMRIPHEYEEFDGGHFNTSYRYDVSLPRMARYFWRALRD